MSVGAINAELGLATGFDLATRAIPRAGPIALEFAAALLAAQAFATAPLTATAPTDGAPKTEAARNVSVAGGVRTTVITYSDGSSDTEVGAAATGDDRREMPPLFLADIARLPLATFKANSDLEPEQGADARSAPRTPWRVKPAGQPSMGAAANREPVEDSIPTAGQSMSTSDWLDLRAGRLFDRLG
jgi:hypothetical protein